MASQPADAAITVSQVNCEDVPAFTRHRFLRSSLASSQSRLCEAQNSPQVRDSMFLKSTSAEQSESVEHTWPSTTSVQLEGLHGAAIVMGDGGAGADGFVGGLVVGTDSNLTGWLADGIGKLAKGKGDGTELETGDDGAGSVSVVADANIAAAGNGATTAGVVQIGYPSSPSCWAPPAARPRRSNADR